jgi:hypothetical protein
MEEARLERTERRRLSAGNQTPVVRKDHSARYYRLHESLEEKQRRAANWMAQNVEVLMARLGVTFGPPRPSPQCPP